MQPPFSAQQFFEVMRHYNLAVWPAQVVLTALALVALGMLVRHRTWSARVILLALAGLWSWIAVMYHLAFFVAINPAAYAFAVLFLAGAAVFTWFAFRRADVAFAWAPGLRGALGAASIVYALVVYPVWSSGAGHAYPDLPTFGLPCPTTIFTIGMLAFVRGARTWPLFVAPVLWSLIGLQAAFLFDVAPDLGLGVAGILAAALAFRPLAPTPAASA
jgi:hypothetical protein